MVVYHKGFQKWPTILCGHDRYLQAWQGAWCSDKNGRYGLSLLEKELLEALSGKSAPAQCRGKYRSLELMIRT